MAAICLLVAFLQILKPLSAGYKPLAEAAGVFFDKHPSAVFAMGKGAGVTAYLHKKAAVVRIDGYGAPDGLIDDIRQSRPLETVLRRLKADFYVTPATDEKKNCSVAREPQKTSFGPNNRAMESWICVSPADEAPVFKNLTLRLYKTSDLTLNRE